MNLNFTLYPGMLGLHDIQQLINSNKKISLDESAHKHIHASVATVNNVISQNKTVYGINTGFSKLANTKIPNDKLIDLQRRIVLSHACGCGELLSDEIVRCILLLKINSLARGFSGIRLEVINALIQLFNHEIYPCIPSKGSVGASGDLAPLAHLSSVLIGYNHARYQGKIISATEALAIAGLNPIELQPKEGLALLNGTQVSTAITLTALLKTKSLLQQAVLIGSLSTDAAMASDAPFNEKLQAVRMQEGQQKIAAMIRDYLDGSEIRQSHVNCDRVQDPYCLRCQPQVLGACLDQINFVETILTREANAVSDNPIVFAEDNAILSGGNFHAEPVALVADNLAIAIAEIGALSERRFALLNDPNFSHLPTFLVEDSGLNSGFMIAQTTAAALASANKSLAHPASVDSIPTGANQEDHVSMATGAGLRLYPMLENTSSILAIELLAACQGIDLRKPLKSSQKLQHAHALVREFVRYYDEDRFFADDILAAENIIQQELLPCIKL